MGKFGLYAISDGSLVKVNTRIFGVGGKVIHAQTEVTILTNSAGYPCGFHGLTAGADMVQGFMQVGN